MRCSSPILGVLVHGCGERRSAELRQRVASHQGSDGLSLGGDEVVEEEEPHVGVEVAEQREEVAVVCEPLPERIHGVGFAVVAADALESEIEPVRDLG